MQSLLQLHLIRQLAIVYALMFFFIASLAHLPGFVDAEGYTFGLFRLELHDDLLHLFSGLWAAFAAWRSTQQSVLYFRLFGLIYFFDGVMGVIFGQGYLDAGIFRFGPTAIELTTKLAANAPHLAIGGIAIAIGFMLSRRYATTAA
ncbi:MAG: hypothetical protein ACT4QE_12335 [Anaerolineales bacterium]